MIYTYRIEDGRPAVNRVIFRIMDDTGAVLAGYLDTCHEARMFCEAQNRKLKNMRSLQK
jgi:hypothetical protein